MRPSFLTCAALAALVSGCQQTPDSNAQALASLRPVADCQSALPFFGHVRYPGDPLRGWQFIPAEGSIQMRNDGGWCSIRHQFNFNGAISTPEMTMLDPPSHGEVVLGALEGRIRLAYQPKPGFIGTDQFRVRLHSPIPEEIPVRVVVIP